MKDMLRLSGVLLFACCATVLAAGPEEEEYVRVYNLIQQGDALKGRGEDRTALENYKLAYDVLANLSTTNPNWQPNIVKYRLKYLQEQIAPLQEKYPAAPVVDNGPAKPNPTGGLEADLHRMNDTLIQLRMQNTKLENKLKEALKALPPDLDPKSLEEARAEIERLSRQVDVQNAIIQSGKSAAPGEATEMTRQLKAERDRNSKLEAENKKLEVIVNDPSHPLPGDTIKKLESENEALKKKYQEALRQLFEKKKELMK